MINTKPLEGQMKLIHLGIPTAQKHEDKTYSYVEKIKLHVTNPDDHEYKLQFVCAEPDSPLPEIVKTEKHLSILVDDMDEAVGRFDRIVYPPTAINETLRICFAVKDDILFELMEVDK
jgi:glyoxylase I family protein